MGLAGNAPNWGPALEAGLTFALEDLDKFLVAAGLAVGVSPGRVLETGALVLDGVSDNFQETAMEATNFDGGKAFR